MKKKKVVKKSPKKSSKKLKMSEIEYRLRSMDQTLFDMPQDFLNRAAKMWDHLLEKVNNQTNEFRANQRKDFFRLEEELKKRQDDWNVIMKQQLYAIAEDSMRAMQALQRMMQVIDDAVFTPEIRQSIINKIRAIPNTNTG